MTTKIKLANNVADVDLTTTAPTDGQGLIYSSTASEWVPGANYTATVYTLTGTDIDAANGVMQSKTLSGATTLTSSLSAGQGVILMLAGGDTNTVTWPTMTWVTSAGNTAPTLTANDTLVLWVIGSTLYGAYVGSYA